MREPAIIELFRDVLCVNCTSSGSIAKWTFLLQPCILNREALWSIQGFGTKADHLISKVDKFILVCQTYYKTDELRESTFIMPRGGGVKMLRGAPKYFLALKGGALKVLDILKGGVLNFSKFWPQQIQVKILTFSGKICVIK